MSTEAEATTTTTTTTTTTSLDDFFAKKDKKKSKKMKNLAANGDAPAKEKKKKEKTASSPSAPDAGPAEAPAAPSPAPTAAKKEEVAGANEDWIELEDEADKDYSGLKIQALRVAEKEEAAKAAEEAAEAEAAAVGGPDGPWKKIEAAPVEEKATTEVVMETKEPTPTAPAKYVPPSVRAAQRQAAQQPAQRRARNARTPLDVNSEEMFPSLGGQRSARATAASAPEPAKSYTSLHLHNKWDSLSRGAAAET